MLPMKAGVFFDDKGNVVGVSADEAQSVGRHFVSRLRDQW